MSGLEMNKKDVPYEAECHKLKIWLIRLNKLQLRFVT